MKINIKPLSVNECFQGRRFKNQKYKNYETELLYKLPKIKLPEPPFEIILKFGLSSKLSDIDNPLKPFIDILQKRYLFNDKDIYMLVVEKEIVKKGYEFIEFSINKFGS